MALAACHEAPGAWQSERVQRNADDRARIKYCRNAVGRV